MGATGMSYSRTARGSIYLYEASQTIDINTANVYHAVIGANEGSVTEGTTYTASAIGSITSTADNGGTLRCTDAAHGLTTGQVITLNGMGDAAHNGITMITRIDDNTFDCDDITYNSAADTGSWQRGTSLTINSGYGGVYSGGYSMSASTAVASKDIRIEVYKNTTAFDEFASERLFGNTGLGVAASGGIGLLQSGDILWMAIQNTTDTQDVVITHMNLHLFKGT